MFRLLHCVCEGVCAMSDLIPCFSPQLGGTSTMCRNTRNWISWKTWPQAWFLWSWSSTSSSQPSESTGQTAATDQTTLLGIHFGCCWCFSFFLKSSSIPSLSLFKQTDFFFFSFVSILLQWTRVRSACFREPALLTSTTSYLTYKHTDLSGMAEKFPPLENNKRAENPFMGEWERNGSSDNGGGVLVCQQHDVCLCRWANRKAETTAVRSTWLCSVCQLCWLRVTPGTGPDTGCTTTAKEKRWVAAEQPSIFNGDDDARGKMSSWSLSQTAPARVELEEEEDDEEEKEWSQERGEVGGGGRIREKSEDEEEENG